MLAEPKAVVLSLVDARKRFGDIEALAGVSLTLGEREWVGLLGPNGAGKSTLMHSIAGLVTLDSGHLELFGQPADSQPADSQPVNSRRTRHRVQVGFVPQDIALYPLLSTEENLRVFGRIHGLRGSDLRRRIAWALEWTDLGGRAATPVGKLSGGMQRRLNIACGVLHGPRLVLLDEPTVGVDPQGRQRIWEMLEELRRGGASLIQSTHGLSEIESRCDRMLIQDHGRIIAVGNVDQLVAESLGKQAVLHLTCDRPMADLPSLDGFESRGSTLYGALRDVSIELPEVLFQVRRAGLEIRCLRVERPSLEAVFTHLTGRELRE